MSVSLRKLPVVVAELSVCLDCTLVQVNDEAPETPDREPWGLIPDSAHIANACAGDEEEEDSGCTDFSSRSCDACGSTLAGERHAFVIFDF